ncbi:hypothetical protein Tco_0238190 [Tanacetum coccineum]
MLHSTPEIKQSFKEIGGIFQSGFWYTGRTSRRGLCSRGKLLRGMNCSNRGLEMFKDSLTHLQQYFNLFKCYNATVEEGHICYGLSKAKGLMDEIEELSAHYALIGLINQLVILLMMGQDMMSAIDSEFISGEKIHCPDRICAVKKKLARNALYG